MHTRASSSDRPIRCVDAVEPSPGQRPAQANPEFRRMARRARVDSSGSRNVSSRCDVSASLVAAGRVDKCVPVENS